MVAESLVHDGHKRMALDVPRKVEVPVRLMNLPLLLKLCRCFSIVWNITELSVDMMARWCDGSKIIKQKHS